MTFSVECLKYQVAKRLGTACRLKLLCVVPMWGSELPKQEGISRPNKGVVNQGAELCLNLALSDLKQRDAEIILQKHSRLSTSYSIVLSFSKCPIT